jgi:hypothetical protein
MTRQARLAPLLGLQRQVRLEAARQRADPESLSLKQAEPISPLLDLLAQLTSVVYLCQRTSASSRGLPE